MKKLFQIDSSFHGHSPVLFAWQPRGKYLATAGANGLVLLFDRHGAQEEEVALPTSAPCLALEWDKDGEFLAIMQANHPVVHLFEVGTRIMITLDTQFKSPTFLRWSSTGPQLVIASSKGALLLYNKETRRKIPIVGKHSKAITCGAWSSTNMLVMGADDSSLSVSRDDGERVTELVLKSEPRQVAFSAQRKDGVPRADLRRLDTTVSAIVGGRMLLIHDTSSSETPYELTFEDRYGELCSHAWYGDGFIMVAFRRGYLVFVSTHSKEMVKEVGRLSLVPDGIDALAYSPVLGRAAVAGGDGRGRGVEIRVVEQTGENKWEELGEQPSYLPPHCGTVSQLGWTDDGQILTVATRSGNVYNFLARMPVLHDACGPRVALLTSLREVTVLDAVAATARTQADPSQTDVDLGRAITVPVEVEPAMVAVGPRHVAVGMNNRVWFYAAEETHRDLENEREYLGTVECIRLNSDFAAVLTNGQVHLHLIQRPAHPGEERARTFPDRVGDAASCVALTEQFLLFGTQRGSVHIFSLAAWQPLSGAELRHTHPIRGLWPNQAGTRYFFHDSEGNAFVQAPVGNVTVQVPACPERVQCVLWDADDWGVFVVCQSRELHSYHYAPLTMQGPQVVKLGPVRLMENGETEMEPRVTRISPSLSPIACQGGVVTCQDETKLRAFVLGTHRPLLGDRHRFGPEQRLKAFAAALGLSRLEQAWELALTLREEARPAWLALSAKAMEQLDIEVAARVYRQLGDAAMVMALEELAHVEDRNLVSGHIATLFGDYKLAQEMFLRSSRPMAALELRCDLLQWDLALKLAQRLSPPRVPLIALRHAQQLEYRGDHAGALALYEQALEGADLVDAEVARESAVARGAPGLMMGRNGWLYGDGGPLATLLLRRRQESHAANDDAATGKRRPQMEGGSSLSAGAGAGTAGAGAGLSGGAEAADGGSDVAMTSQHIAGASLVLGRAFVVAEGGQDPGRRHRRACHAGIARACVRGGDTRRGLAIVRELDDPGLSMECARILEDQKMYLDAAELFERAGSVEKAVEIYLVSKNFGRAAPLIGRVQSKRLLEQFAKARETERDFEGAARAFERAGNLTNVVRLYLEKLQQPEKAFELARRTGSADAARQVAEFCRRGNNVRGAIEFLLMANQSEEAFALAQEHNEVGTFASALGDEGAAEDFKRIAEWFERGQQWAQAGRYHARCGQYHKAVNLFLRAGESMLDEAIEVVGKAKSDVLTHKVSDYLMGEQDGVPKDPQYILKMYMALKNYRHAARTAIIIARQEQELGNYKLALSFLLDTARALHRDGQRVPQALMLALELLHSYLLVKRHVRLGDHATAARLLVRVAKNVSKFPKHTVPILTSAVIETQRAKLRQSSFSYASMLMRPEYRSQIDPKFKRKIEAIVRKKPTAEDPEESARDCPFCSHPVSVGDLNCRRCMNRIPMCIATGTHIVADDLTQCPSCHFPAVLSSFRPMLMQEPSCPLCSAPVTADQLTPAADAKAVLKQFSGAEDDEEEEGGEGEGKAAAGTGAGAGAAGEETKAGGV